MSSELGSLAKGGDSFEMLSQNLPGLHLGIGELLVCPGDFG